MRISRKSGSNIFSLYPSHALRKLLLMGLVRNGSMLNFLPRISFLLLVGLLIAKLSKVLQRSFHAVPIVLGPCFLNSIHLSIRLFISRSCQLCPICECL